MPKLTLLRWEEEETSQLAMWFKLYCQRWRTSQGHMQSRTLEKW